MRLKPLIATVAVLLVAVLLGSRVDWGFTALRTYMAVSQPLETEDAPYRETSGGVPMVATALTDELDMPWSLAFMPSGDILITERSGALQRLDPATGALTAIEGVPEVHYKGQGGLLDVALHPAFPQQPWVYLTYSAPLGGRESTTRLARGRLEGDRLADLEILYSVEPAGEKNKHYGSKLLFDGDYLYMTMGERGRRHLSQDLGTDMGKLLRFNTDGSVAAGNPFADTPGARPAIYSYGHRNPQGLARHPETGELWVTEHGPQGGDELNRIVPGANYGWPVITYGEEYGGGKIGEGTHKAGMEQPVYYYVPSIAVAGLAFYSGEQFPGWQGDAFIAALRAFHLNRVSFADDGTPGEQRLLEDLNLRLRDVKVGPDGNLYLLSEQGSLVRLAPDDAAR